MPQPVKIRTSRPAKAVSPAPDVAALADVRGPQGGTAMESGPAAVVAARARAGNAAVTAAMGGLPRGAKPDASGWAGQMLLAGQNLVGNQAVAAQATAPPEQRQQPAKQRQQPAKQQKPKPVRKAKAPPAPAPGKKDTGQVSARGDKETKEEAAGARSPGEDPKFQALKKDVGAKKRRIGTSHPPAATEADAAQGAAAAPDDDQEARGKAAHAEDMDAAQPKEFDKASFIAAVEKAIKDRAPKNLDEADNFGDSGKAEEVKTEVQGKVGEGKDAAACEIADTTAATPQPAPDAKAVVPLAADKVPGKPGVPNPNQAAPDVLPPSATDMSAGPKKVNDQMAAAGVTEEQLSFTKSKEKSFDKAVGDKKEMEAHSKAAPKQLRAGESRELKKVKGAAAQNGTAAMGGMHATRVNCGRQVTTGKEGTKGRDEDKRAQVTALLQKVFDDTKSDVEKTLADLDKKVDDQFTKGEKRARDRFTDEHTRGMDEYKDRRYSGLTGKARWVKDLFADLPEEANRIYERARDNYLTAMRQVISDVADIVVGELKKAKDRIAKGRKELKDALDRLPKDLKAIGKEAAADFEGQFDSLQDSVNDKGTQLVDALATRYTDAVKAVDEEIAAEKEKNKGLVSKAAAAIGGVINTIKELGRLLMGVLRKAASAVGLILRDPIGFLGRLVSGVGGGLRLFMKDAGRYLQQGVLAWLLGSGVGGGLQLPATFDILGILVMIAGLLGLNWPTIRARLSRKVSPKTMAAAETGKDAIPIVVEVKKRGVAGMWTDLRSRVGDLKKDLIGKLVQYLLPTIIIAGVTWIVSLFNPASAFIRACKMIIDIVRFIVTQARQIIEFVNAVLDAVIAIARGAANVAGLVVRALARSIPVLIGALAALLGIGGIGGRVKQIFHQIARPVKRAIDWVIDKIGGLLKKLGVKLKPKVKPKKKRPDKPRRPARDRTRRRRRRDDDRRGPRKRRPDRRRDRRRDKRDARDKKKKKRSLDAALREATRLLKDNEATPESIKRKLPAIKRRHKLRSIQLKKIGKDSYAIRLSINPEAQTRPEELFPYEIARAKGEFTISRREGAFEQLSPHHIPMEGLDRRTGFVITIAAIPDEVTKKPDIATRYLTAGWEGGAKDIAAARTAVVIGVNGLEHLDPAKGKKEISTAVGDVKKTPELLLAVFGFIWTPRWVKRGTQDTVPFSEVRSAYNDLQDADLRKFAENNEKGLRDKKALPYGLFRQEVLNSSYTDQAVSVLKDMNDAVYVVGQDADTGVAAKNAMGVLAAYKKVLDEMAEDPLLVVGGYHFAGYQWAGRGAKRKEQLTVQFNEIDRAARIAINEKYPQMLYPTEPNMLIKAFENRAGRLRGIFQDTRARALMAAQGEIYGIGAAEGRFLRNKLMEVFGPDFTIVFVPEVSTVTSPAPGDVARRLEQTPAHVRAAQRGKELTPDASGKPEETGTIRRAHSAYAMIMQSQTMLSAVNLAREFTMATPGLAGLTRSGQEKFRGDLQDKIFTHVEDVVLLMADKPKLTASSPEIQAQLGKLRDAVATLADGLPARGREAAQEALAKADELAKGIINAMTVDELKSVWRPLSSLLKTIDRERRRRERG
ncbi:hypothetical protein BLA60_15460 [Actinophytocola xinjiangensis]|uniref:Uncharacterized protein n=1 Tax=Actinophytocola xinjiangensis TaxID=485602 RepID=A0A7Z0WQF4_9PSEU|nr:hypothetical protein [Actinophytocola xinjiangensis]OLF10576.1 hypothetical protein BLA60_15460 [Actinophytocola xinjiangensis]